MPLEGISTTATTTLTASIVFSYSFYFQDDDLEELARLTQIFYRRHVASSYSQHYTGTQDIWLQSVTLRANTNQVDVKFGMSMELHRTGGLPTSDELENSLESVPTNIYIENFIGRIPFFSE